MKKCTKCGETKAFTAFSSHRDTGDGLQANCKACRAAWLRQHRAENRDYWVEYGRQYRAKNRERLRAKARARYEKDPVRHTEIARRGRIKKNYGLTLEVYDAIIARGCAICGAHGPRMALDHDHANGQIRDALCSNCNNGLGRFKDNPARLRAAADYLEKHRR